MESEWRICICICLPGVRPKSGRPIKSESKGETKDLGRIQSPRFTKRTGETTSSQGDNFLLDVPLMARGHSRTLGQGLELMDFGSRRLEPKRCTGPGPSFFPFHCAAQAFLFVLLSRSPRTAGASAWTGLSLGDPPLWCLGW